MSKISIENQIFNYHVIVLDTIRFWRMTRTDTERILRIQEQKSYRF